MPKRGQTNAIREADRLRYVEAYARMKRADKDLTFERVGKKVGLSKSSISKIFSGEEKQSTRKTALDAFFGVPPEESPIIKRIVSIIIELDDAAQHRLLERALVLLEEQQSHDN
jgi:transcriptional regulator with XRE-family HTH domain